MNALSTMLLISDAFVELCDEMPLRKVSISDIVERTGKNRKTFYYHFENKDRLIIWIFRYDMGQCLKQHFSESVLLYDDDPEDPTSRFPYYITQKSGVRSLDHAEFFQCFAEVLEGRRNFYRQALVDNGPYSLRNYLYALYLEAMKRDIDIILSNRYLPKDNIDFLAEFYTCAFLYYYIRRCDARGVESIGGQARPLRQHHPQLPRKRDQGSPDAAQFVEVGPFHSFCLFSIGNFRAVSIGRTSRRAVKLFTRVYAPARDGADTRSRGGFMGKLTDEEFRDFLKTCRELAEGPFEEMQRR